MTFVRQAAPERKNDPPTFTVGHMNVSRAFGPENSADLACWMRLSVSRKRWRTSPHIFGLSLVKRAIVSAYAHHAIGWPLAQRAIDIMRAWEA